ncbi:MAG: ATP-binding cassette domain-containing protein [Anaerolineae bacterium]|nr:ATP-binding cassette domain-containing protein [Anaerolineae bacterium]
MSDSTITVRHLTKTYRVPERAPGLKAAIGSMLHRTYRDVEAVRDISFTIAQGEMVGFIGPNGAGKTTTLKILSGLMHPTLGSVKVLGYVPWRRQHTFLRQISMVLGNKSQMLWDLPPVESFTVLGEIYKVPANDLQQTLDELVSLLDMEDLLTKPVRNFSLGERMKCELVAGLLHRPQVLFLDEPTLGLDVSMQARLRAFFKTYNQRMGVTVMLTSHYMADVVALCSRVILIHHGQLLYDGALTGLADKLAPFKLLHIHMGGSQDVDAPISLPEGTELIDRQQNNLTVRVPKLSAPALTARILGTLPVVDLTVEDPPIEAVIDQIYQNSEVLQSSSGGA